MTGRILTSLQEKVLVTLFDNGLGERGYFLTGGTALAEFYLQHRYSDDLDFFTRGQRDPQEDLQTFRNILISNGFEITDENLSGHHIRFNVKLSDQQIEPLKIEFIAREVPAMMAPTQVQGKVVIDSFEDIAVNKICAIFGRRPPDVKDYIDLFFILKESSYSVDYLLSRAKEKEAPFEHEYGVFSFAINLKAVGEFSDFGKIEMKKPLTLEALKARLIPIADDLLRRLRPRGE